MKRNERLKYLHWPSSVQRENALHCIFIKSAHNNALYRLFFQLKFTYHIDKFIILSELMCTKSTARGKKELITVKCVTKLAKIDIKYAVCKDISV